MSINWALVDHISTLVIAMATIVGFVTLYFSQRALHADERRRKLRVAIEQNEKFIREIIPHQKTIWDGYTSQRMSHAFAPGPSTPLVLTAELREGARIHFNALESWALYIETGLADEALLYRVSGAAYCEQVRVLAQIAGLTTAEAVSLWPPVYALYEKWNGRRIEASNATAPKPVEP